MGKKIRIKERKQRDAERDVAQRLEAHSRIYVAPAAVTGYDGFATTDRAKIEHFRADILRLPATWRCRIKSRCPHRRFLDLVRHTFARYPVPAHLEAVWTGDPRYGLDDRLDPVETRPDPRRSVDLRTWYLIAAQGGSLYKRAAYRYFSKQETHHFLAAPAEVGTTAAAFWYAIARAHGAGRHAALQIARTRIVRYSPGSSFWQEVARFFARNAATVAVMDDLIDFFDAMKQADPAFTLKSRALAALMRRQEEWLRALRKQAQVCGGSWAGVALADCDYEAGSEGNRAIWHFRQIKTGNDLYREGQRMHHCVVTYKDRCAAGAISIWSLTSEFPIGKVNRGVTMEVTAEGAIVQCRGFANRLPYANEVTMAKRWARDTGLTWQSLTR